MPKDKCLVCKLEIQNGWFLGYIHDHCFDRIKEIVIEEDNIRQLNRNWYEKARKALGIAKRRRRK